ncbi:MAG: 50S ribosomal protein L10, partial [bacterium]|nr:50S ribosomal protein L10 [bacterium]
MARPEKEKLVDDIADKLKNSASVYLADYKGLNVEEINDLRNQLRERSVEFIVVKNTLARLSANKVGYENLVQYLTGPTAMAFALADPIIGAKVLVDFAKKNEKLAIKACIFDGQIYDQTRVRQIAQIPSKEQVLAQTLGMISGPLRGLVNVVHGLLSAT